MKHQAAISLAFKTDLRKYPQAVAALKNLAFTFELSGQSWEELLYKIRTEWNALSPLSLSLCWVFYLKTILININ